MANLYDLTAEYAALLAAYDVAEDDAQRADVLTMIDQVQEGIGDKAEAYARIIKNLQADADAFDAEAKRMAAKAKAAKNAVEGLKARLLDAMQQFNATEIKTSIGKWRIQNNPWSCEITEPDKVPAEYHVPQPDKIDRVALLKRFRETGEMLDGVEYIQTAGLRFR